MQPTPTAVPAVSFEVWSGGLKKITSGQGQLSAELSLGTTKRGIQQAVQLVFKNTSSRRIELSNFRLSSGLSTSLATSVSVLPNSNLELNFRHLANLAGIGNEMLNFTVTNSANLNESYQLQFSIAREVQDVPYFNIIYSGAGYRLGGEIRWTPQVRINSCNVLSEKRIEIQNLGAEELKISWTYDGSTWITSNSGYGGYFPYTLAANSTGRTSFEFYPCRAGIKSSTALIRVEVPSRPELPAEIVPISLWAEAVVPPLIDLKSDGFTYVQNSFADLTTPVALGFARSGTVVTKTLSIKNATTRSVNLRNFTASAPLRILSSPAVLAPGATAEIVVEWSVGANSLTGTLGFSSSYADFETSPANISVNVIGEVADTPPSLLQDVQILDSSSGVYPISQNFDLGRREWGSLAEAVNFYVKNRGQHKVQFYVDTLSGPTDLQVSSPSRGSVAVILPGESLPIQLSMQSSRIGNYAANLAGRIRYQVDAASTQNVQLAWSVRVEETLSASFSLNPEALFNGLLEGVYRLSGTCPGGGQLQAYTTPGPSGYSNLSCLNNTYQYEYSPIVESQTNGDRFNATLQVYNQNRTPSSRQLATYEFNRRPSLFDFPEGKALEGAQSEGSLVPARNGRALVLYNSNVSTARELAEFYAYERNIPNANICGVATVPGVYASIQEYEGAKKQILKDCICPIAESLQSRDLDCGSISAPELQRLSYIDHIIFMRGWPSRLTFNDEDPSLDAYLSMDLFAYSDGRWGPYRVHWGRIDGVSSETAKRLVLRAKSAEQSGLDGKLITQANPSQYFMRYGSTPADLCRANIEDGAVWNSNACDVGYEKTGLVPGYPGSSTASSLIPNISMFLGTNPWPNNQNAFNASWDTMLKWRRNSGSCIPLCKDFTTSVERAECRATSQDYFKEINTSCIGGAPGFMGMQLRSWPAVNIGFVPPGYDGPGSGQVNSVPAEMILQNSTESGGNYYVRFGLPDANENATCTDVSGNTFACPQRIPQSVVRGYYNIAAAAHADTDGVLRLRLKVDVRNKNQAGSAFTFMIIPQKSNYVQLEQRRVDLNLGIARAEWQNETLEFVWTGLEPNEKIADLVVYWLAATELKGYVEFDNLQVENEVGAAMLTQAQSEFSEARNNLPSGSWVSTTIERMGAMAWWGSNSHHRTGGFAFGDHPRLFDLLLSGSSLGEAISHSSGLHSGFFVGDPLYQPAAARIDLRDTRFRLVGPKRWALNLPLTPVSNSTVDRFVVYGSADSSLDAPIEILAFNGTQNDSNTAWSVEYCAQAGDPRLCDQNSSWQTLQSGTGAVRELRSLALKPRSFINSFQSEQYLNFRLKVNTGVTPEIRGYLLLHYKP
jgi:hypothetical protein